MVAYWKADADDDNEDDGTATTQRGAIKENMYNIIIFLHQVYPYSISHHRYAYMVACPSVQKSLIP